MRVEDFKKVISEFLTSSLPEIKEREISLPIDSSLIISVTGGRRAGKTYVLFDTIRRIIKEGKAKQDEILYVDFEHARLKGITAADLDDMIIAFYELTGKAPKYLFLDEIQSVKDYGSWFRKRLDKVFISGSSSSLSPRNIAEELRGRSINFEVFPLSFKEYLSFLNVNINPRLALYSDEKGKLLSLLRDYLYYGAYPAVVLEKDKEMKRRILQSYFDSVIVRDLGGESIAEYLATYLISNYSSLISYNKVYNYLRSLGFKVGKEKLLETIGKAMQSYFLFEVEIFEKSERKRKTNPKKIYIIDSGYPTALGYEFSISKAMENTVFLHLRRMRGKGGKEDVFYWKEYGKSEGSEVDFVIAENFVPKELIQVTYAEDRIDEREIRALKKAEKELNPGKMTIITWNYYGKIDNIQAVPLWLWLLQEK